MVKCTKCQRIVRREADGTSAERVRCIHGAAKTFRQTVSEEDCDKCAIRQTWDCNCSVNPPKTPVFQQPILGCQSEIIYLNGSPPCPFGHRITADPLKFESEWPVCAYLETANELNPDGSIKIKARCSITQRLIDPDTCNQCNGDISLISPKEYPAVVQELKTYAIAVKNWVGAGRPIRTDAEVEAIHSQYCSQCDWYDKDQQRCKGCGCKAKAEGAALLNKIKMSTQHCPKQLW